MSKLAALKAASTLREVALLLNFKPQALSYLLYHQPLAHRYRTFHVPKRQGGHRTINAPNPALGLLQRRLSDILQDCSDEIDVAAKRKDRIVHGFKRERSIITNSREHRHRRYVFNLDLENYFPSINFGRVRGFFIVNRDFALHTDVATMLAQIACHDNELPQGSPCSPVVANLVTHILDMRLVNFAADIGWTYSRYTDDLTFSTNKKDISEDIATREDDIGSGAQLWSAGAKLRDVITRAGFRINDNKSRLMYRTSRQDVTGIVVNQKISVRWEYRHDVRAMVHRLVKTGSYERLGSVLVNGNLTIQKRAGTLNELHGMLGFINSIDNYNTENKLSTKGAKPLARERVFREFLLYRLFYAAEKPIVVCEGDTDTVYLVHAIRSLAADFPALAEVRPSGEIKLKIRFFRHKKNESSTAIILKLRSGGSSSLADFMRLYAAESKHFTAPGLGEPVIILYDSDSGAKSINPVILNLWKIQAQNMLPFTHLQKNLYAVPTPLVGNAKMSQIEDFFDDATKQIQINGKSFDPANDHDTATTYGKRIFAHGVVRPNANKIDFSGFRPLLTNLAAAIDKHHAAVIKRPVAP